MTNDLGPFVAIQIDRQSLRVFSQADIDSNRVHEGDKGNQAEKEAEGGQG